MVLVRSFKLHALQGSRLNDLLSQNGQLLTEEIFQVFGRFRDWRIWLIEETAVLEDSHHVTDKLTQLAVVLLNHSLFNGFLSRFVRRLSCS